MEPESDSKKSTKIMEAAALLMRQKSFKDVSMEELAARAGVAKGTLYLYFRSKGDVYLSLLLEKLQDFAGLVDEVYKRNLPSARETLEEVLQASLTLLAEKPHSGRIPMLALPGTTPEEIEDELQSRFFPALEKLKKRLSSVFKKGVRKGEFRKLRSEKLAGLFLHLLEYSHIHALYLSERPTDPGKEVEFIKDVFFKGIET